MYSQVEREINFNYIGELVHIVQVEACVCSDDNERILVTSVDKREGSDIMYVYCNGEKLTRKIIAKGRPWQFESFSFLDGVCMDYSMGTRL